ncbi:phosphomevalonate kinase isoform X1 [Harpegnathos saltator]|nr:phosphomevalonate kinase isoform X1 [Harpegnathos saltator]XP_011135600.1 phosphomevalonate kinase isoform X1 [Harpegnathos saltator]XP_025161659.1 phosphomevalonate kinase isoform X1 [Harpegnathos saltator]
MLNAVLHCILCDPYWKTAKMADTLKPKRILLFSGKRKSGKDYITDILHKRLSPQGSTIIRLSGPIKTHWAKLLNLDLDQLLGDGKYKEEYRIKMCEWGESMRAKDSGYFCRAAIDMYKAKDKPIWIVSDLRRKSDIEWFTKNYGDICKTIRIICSDEIRQKRGWIYTLGVDDAETECDLDDVNTWDILLENNDENLENILQQLLELVD